MQMMWLYNLARTEGAPEQLSNNHGLKCDFPDSCFVQYFNYIFKKILKHFRYQSIFIYID